MNDARVAGIMALAVLLYSVWLTVQDWREGKARLLIFSRRRNPVSIERATDPRRFQHYCAFNAAVYLVGIAGSLYLIIKPQG
ncbi:hypothetical protein EDF56_104553 [Novosphingobium sp. PhB165]|uniref:hypothetical protein n=1 Tax=Novosphingobium sp. PhB165 TaxID=2485105 RepID=UPI00104A5CF4|nr:hypothetical protein [Novosphingobium sp. PhB165]TCM19018.1 hypothetical protein EDF56_104553 [Novosphingobium sp. PhB165]